MQQENAKWNLFATIGGLLVVTLLINGFFLSRAVHNREIKAQQAREAADAAQREQAAKEKQERERAAIALREQAAREENERAERERAAAALREETAKAAREQQERELAAAAQREEVARQAREQQEREQQAVAQREQAAREAIAQEQREKAAVALREEMAKQAKEAAAKAAEDAATAHALHLARYLNTEFERQPQTPTIAVAIATEERTANRTVATALAQHLQTKNLRMLSSFFKPEVVQDGLLTILISGRAEDFANLELTNSVDAVLLGQQKVEYSTNASLANTVTANLQLELVALPVRATGEKQTWSFSAIGVGFQPREARALAEERLLNQIARDTNMIMAPSLPRGR